MYSQRVDAQMAPTAGSSCSSLAPPVDRKDALQVPEAARQTNRHALTKATEIKWNGITLGIIKKKSAISIQAESSGAVSGEEISIIPAIKYGKKSRCFL